MGTKDKGRILMLCGALHDIAEKAKEKYTKSQIKQVQLKLQEIVYADLTKYELEENLLEF